MPAEYTQYEINKYDKGWWIIYCGCNIQSANLICSKVLKPDGSHLCLDSVFAKLRNIADLVSTTKGGSKLPKNCIFWL